MNLKQVYMEAARKIAEGEEKFSCMAIGRHMPRGREWARGLAVPSVEAVVAPYVDLMSDGCGEDALQAMIECDCNGGATWDLTEHQNMRVMLLCMMAAVS